MIDNSGKSDYTKDVVVPIIVAILGLLGAILGGGAWWYRGKAKRLRSERDLALSEASIIGDAAVSTHVLLLDFQYSSPEHRFGSGETSWDRRKISDGMFSGPVICRLLL